jgi:hypothetical protein
MSVPQRRRSGQDLKEVITYTYARAATQPTIDTETASAYVELSD